MWLANLKIDVLVIVVALQNPTISGYLCDYLYIDSLDSVKDPTRQTSMTSPNGSERLSLSARHAIHATSFVLAPSCHYQPVLKSQWKGI